MIAALALIGSASSAVAQTLPVFQFREIRADQPIDPQSIGFKECQSLENGLRRCMPRSGSDRVANVFVIPMMILNGSKLASFELIGIQSGYGSIKDAFAAKYGTPCQSRTDKWQNRIGNSFDNEVTVWCFATGRLELKALGNQVDQWQARYVDAVNTPPSTPKVDF
ncbi:hypothetical protein [Sphingomonas limnosediminicola]|uniref:hypothetical protein n=1 Tax=Sphingomonas limnosediminicola TaxID=940133 RepID=UPI0031D8BF5C